jgi:hypothetical protein
MIDRSLLKSDDDDALSTPMATKHQSTQNKIYTREPGMNCSRVSRAGGSRKDYLSNANCFRGWFLLQDLARTEVTIPLDYCCRHDLSHFSRAEMIRIAATRLLIQQLYGMIDALSPSLRDSRLFEVRLHKILRCFCNDLNVISCDRKRGYKKGFLQSENFFKALLSISPDIIISAGIISCSKENLHRTNI